MMMFADRSRGKPFSKGPAVVEFDGRYLLYYSIPPYKDGRNNDGWRIGIATSSDLDAWEKIGELPPLSPCDVNGGRGDRTPALRFFTGPMDAML